MGEKRGSVVCGKFEKLSIKVWGGSEGLRYVEVVRGDPVKIGDETGPPSDPQVGKGTSGLSGQARACPAPPRPARSGRGNRGPPTPLRDSPGQVERIFGSQKTGA